MVSEAAVGVEVEGGGGSELGAVNAGGAQARSDLGRIGGAVEVQLAGEVAAPAGIGAGEEAGKLAQLRLPPVEIEMHGHLMQIGRAAHGGFHAHHAGVFLVEAYVGAGRLAAQANAPLAGILLPDGEIGVDDGERQFFHAVLEVDAGVCGLKVG